MLKHAIWVIFLGLLIGGCASDGKMENSDSSSSLAGAATVPSDSMSGGAAVSSPTMSAAAASTDTMTPSTTSKNRIAAGVEEETLDACLGRIPKDATAGQRMLAEHTCRRDFGSRR